MKKCEMRQRITRNCIQWTGEKNIYDIIFQKIRNIEKTEKTVFDVERTIENTIKIEETIENDAISEIAKANVGDWFLFDDSNQSFTVLDDENFNNIWEIIE